MSFVGLTFDGQNVSPKMDGGLYGYCSDGVIWGCGFSYLDRAFYVDTGLFMACGRLCYVDGQTTISTTDAPTADGYVQIIMNYDLTQAEGSQWYITKVYRASDMNFSPLTQGEINGTSDTLYQFEIAVLHRVQDEIVSIERSMPKMSVGQITRTSTTTAQTALANTDLTLLTINKPADKTFGIATGRCGFSVSQAGVNVRMSLADNDTDHYINGTDSRSLGISGIVINGNASLKILVRSTTTTASVASAFLDVLWF